jgi:trans-aconitate methyltransferase
MLDGHACQVCAGSNLEEISQYRALSRVTSDCKPFPTGGMLVECADCGATQKLPTSLWLKESATIYAGYTPYFQADGIEQVVMDSQTNTLHRRSDVLVSRLKEEGLSTVVSRVLDVGCGNGATLAAISRDFQGSQLYGHEVGLRDHSPLVRIPRFKQLYTCPLYDIPIKFDLITSVHSLEHFPSAFQTLQSFRDKLSDRGLLFVQVCNSAENPFDLLIADHMMHFTPRTLARLVERAGFRIIKISTDWIPKELSMVVAPGTGTSTFDSYAELRGRESTVEWLQALHRKAELIAKRSTSFGIFGTSIAGSWLASSLSATVDFFVDEDPLRQHRTYLGRPVVGPADVQRGSTVFLALVPGIAEKVRNRLEHLRLSLVTPDPLPLTKRVTS